LPLVQEPDVSVPDRVLHWVASGVGTAEASWARRLAGGTHARTDVVTTADGREFVLRRFPVGDDAVHRETRVLAALDGLDGRAPRLIAADPDGVATGAPAIVTTLVPGSAWITPDDPADFVLQLGRALARIHDYRVDPGLLEIAPHSSGPPVLTHFDFWSGNTVWRGGRLSGVVDWGGARLGPRGFDLAWARLDLILLFGVEIADVLTSAYLDAADGPVIDVERWDRHAATKADADVESWAPNYQDLGRTDLGPATLRRRLTEWTARIGRAG
jgi:aminoglycoside phosphotransferase (APT) family kinase protein